MPNIEIHGISMVSYEFKAKIFDMFKGTPYVDKMVITIYPTEVEDKDGQKQPFLRLVASYQQYNQEILKKLETLDMDIEYMVLARFIPKKGENNANY